MSWLDSAPALVLRDPLGPAVAHLLLQVPPGHSAQALHALGTLEPSFGRCDPAMPFVSVGVSFAGLVALGLPERYQRVFLRLAPAFHAGAVRRSTRRGDGGANAVEHWRQAFWQDRAHVLVSWHGDPGSVKAAAEHFRRNWPAEHGHAGVVLRGERLGAPPGQTGEWVHFGYRDGLSEVQIEPEPPPAADPRRHEAGELLLGHPNDAGSNRFALPRAREKARTFFRNGSFGIFRPLLQDLRAFEDQLDQWQGQLQQPGGQPVTRDYLRAKLCGRWPDGRVMRPGEYAPGAASPQALRMAAALQDDPAGLGCPFGSHVRRMRPAPGADGNTLPRPLQRRSVPFGPAAWNERPSDGVGRGLLGHFFCASIETQFEHLLGQWSARPPLGLPLADRARDPLIGPHEDPSAALCVPLDGQHTHRLTGFRRWTRTIGTLYGWYPGRESWAALLAQDYAPIEDEEPWL